MVLLILLNVYWVCNFIFPVLSRVGMAFSSTPVEGALMLQFMELLVHICSVVALLTENVKTYCSLRSVNTSVLCSTLLKSDKDLCLISHCMLLTI